MNVSFVPYAFVGRQEEMTLFEALLANRKAGTVVYLAAPAGMGKTRMLEALERLAEADAARTTRLSALEIPPVPKRIRAVVSRALTGDASAREVLLVDDFQAHARLERWYGNELVPSLPANALVVIAGRGRLERSLVEKLKKRGMFEERLLSPLHPTAAAELLRAHGVELSRIPAMVDTSGGIPLILTELARIHRERGPRAQGDYSRQEALTALFRRMHADIPTDDHRRALWALGLASPLSPRLLAATLDSADTRGQYRWLAKQTFVHGHQEQLVPLELYRDAAMLDLLRSAPTQYRTMLWRAGQHLLAHFNSQRTFEGRRETIAALLHLQRPPTGQTPSAHGLSGVEVLASERDARAALRTLRQMGARVPPPLLEALEAQPGECVVLRQRNGDIVGLMHFASTTARRAARDRTRQALDHIDRLASVDRPGRRRKMQGPRALVCTTWLSEPVERDSAACETAYRELLERTLGLPDLRIMAVRTDLSHPLFVEAAQRLGLLGPPPAVDPGEALPPGHVPWLLLRDNDRDPPGKWLRVQLGRAISGQDPDPILTGGEPGGGGQITRSDFSEAVRKALPRIANPAELLHSRLASVAMIDRNEGGTASSIRRFIARGLEVMAQSNNSRSDARRLRRHYGIGEALDVGEEDEPVYDSPSDIRSAEDRLVAALWQEHVQRLRARSSA